MLIDRMCACVRKRWWSKVTTTIRIPSEFNVFHLPSQRDCGHEQHGPVGPAQTSDRASLPPLTHPQLPAKMRA